MEFAVKNGQAEKQSSPILCIGVFENKKLSPSGEKIDKATGGFITKILKKGDFEAKIGENQIIYEIPKISADKIILIGLGKKSELSVRAYQKTIDKLAVELKKVKGSEATLFLPEIDVANQPQTENIKQAIRHLSAQWYTFEQLKSKPSAKKPKIKRIAFFLPEKKDVAKAKKAIAEAEATALGMDLMKDLSNLSPNVCDPDYLVKQAKEMAKIYPNLKVEIVSETKMKRLGMGSFLAVSHGSDKPGYIIVMRYEGGPKKQAPVCLVGKGITFDTGGLSLKPPGSMVGMKYDMCGAASVFGAMKSVLELELPLNVIGVVAAAENMPSARATRPDDVVTSLSGQTIEISNTDAEGRLVLADALTYIERYKPGAVIDIATLTGACVVALGSHATGLIANKQSFADEILLAGQTCDDRAWQLPLWEEYDQQLESKVADVCNIGGREAGTITAACFLSRFTKDYTWAHLDIAGTAAKMSKDGLATGRPIPLLVQFLINRAEQGK